MKKDKIYKLLSLLLVVLMMAAASLTVTSSWSSRNISRQNDSNLPTEPAYEAITTAADGVTVVHTAKLSGTTNGYAGPVDLDISLADNKITEIKALENTETPSFFKRASELLTSWNGKTPEEALEMKVDAISGATYSSAAIIDNVNVGLKYYLSATDQTVGYD
ncbi:MAG: FMN-binding protein, partial [Muribaculaceae bacterium]|nr:FMN-binding protein [Muribaculaceae bacterium]